MTGSMPDHLLIVYEIYRRDSRHSCSPLHPEPDARGQRSSEKAVDVAVEDRAAGAEIIVVDLTSILSS